MQNRESITLARQVLFPPYFCRYSLVFLNKSTWQHYGLVRLHGSSSSILQMQLKVRLQW